MKQKPAHEIKVGGIRATIWANNDKGGSQSFFVCASRTFMLKGEWCQTSIFYNSHLPKLIEVLTKAHQWIALREPTVPEPALA